MRDRGNDDGIRTDRRGGAGLRPSTEHALVLAAAGLLMMAVGVFGYVMGEVPVSTERALLPLQLVTPRTFGWILAVLGVLTVGLAAQRSTVRLGYGVAVGAFAVMGAWFALGFASNPSTDTRPLASAALYLFLTGILLVQARSTGRASPR